MIDLNFGLFHSGCRLSYLRYLTFATLRHFHPDAKISLYISNKANNSGHRWNVEKQDFEVLGSGKDYVSALGKLNVEVVYGDFFSHVQSNYQSDFFRYWFLNKDGGFYLDTDQIVLRSFKELPLESDNIFCHYANYHPVGILGAKKGDKNIQKIMKELPKRYDPNDYNSIGPWLMRAMWNKIDHTNLFNAPSNYFYPIPLSNYVGNIYSGQFKIPSESYAMHWFGGSPLSQQFNKGYTEEFAKTSDDTISRKVRELGII